MTNSNTIDGPCERLTDAATATSIELIIQEIDRNEINASAYIELRRGLRRLCDDFIANRLFDLARNTKLAGVA